MPKYFSNITIIEITQALVMMMYQICMTFLGIAPTVMRIYVATFSKNLFTLILHKHNIYVLWRIIYWFKIVLPLFKNKGIQGVFVGIYLFFASSIFWGAFLPKSAVQRAIHRFGNVWIATFIYMLFFIKMQFQTCCGG